MDEGLLNDLLECSVCLERLDTSSRVLPCQHTFCIQCLREIIYCQKELRCPECRVLVETPVDELPPNVLLMRILEGMRNSGGQRSHSSPPPPQVVIPRRPIIGPATFMDPVSSYGFTYSDGDGKYTNVIPKCTPHARALYDYFSKEPGDLNFKKGEVIILRRQIDTFWYHGETGGNQGAFPITYAKIVVQLSPQIPQCTALYDFYMAAHEDEGCLAFNKGAVINVIRRVDENWAEGKLQDKIGIFPIAFVEMNGPALSIINSYNRGNNSAVNKQMVRSSPAPQLSKTQQLNYGQKQTVGSAILANQVGYRPQPMSISSPVPSMGIAVQRQQHNMSQSHPSYIHYQHHPHPNPEPNKSGTPYIDLFEFQAGTHNRSMQQEPVSSDSHVKYSNIPMEVRAQSSSQAEPNVQNKVKQMNPKFSNMPSNYNPNNNISSDSSSTTTTPSFGGSSITTTPNTSSSNTSSASESNTPSSPASPATNNQKPNTANNSPSLPQNQTIREESNEQGDTSEQANVSNQESSVRNAAQQSQNMNGNVLNVTPPRSNMSSPQICAGGSNNSTLTPNQISSQLDSLQLNSNAKKNSSPNQNYVNIQPKSEPQAGTSNHTFNSLYTFTDQLMGEHMISPMHGRKEANPLTATPRNSHSHHREREKRNSLTPGGQIMSTHSTTVNRHSAEILGPSRSLLEQELSQDTTVLKTGDKHRFEKELGLVEKDKSKKSSSSNQFTSYVALYAYKPQKPDELELKKGGLYMVLEQCQDGWYKGCSCRTQKCGVFPGNYVIPVSKAQQMSASTKNKQQASPNVSKSTKESSSSSNSNKNKNVDMSQFQTPPDLPPRSHSPTLHKRSSPKSAPAKSNDKSKEKCKGDKSVSSGVSLMKRLTGMKNRRSPPPTYTAGFSMDNPVFEDCSSENPISLPPAQQAAPQQAIHTRSGSCPSQLLQGTPSGTMNTQMQTIPTIYYKTNVNLDCADYGTQITVGGSVSSAVAHRLFPTHHMVKGMGSQTLGPSHGFGQVQRRQPRPTVLNALIGPDVSIPSNTNNVKQQQGITLGRPSGEAPWFPVPTRHHHRKSHSLDAGQQLKPGKENSREPINKRFRCIVAYPPNSEYELELQVDDVVLVHKQWGEGWYKGTHERTGNTGLVPASFVEAC